MAKIAINIGTGSLQKEDMIVGIDLGTTNSLVAVIHPETGKPVALKEYDGSSIVPSLIHFSWAGLSAFPADRSAKHTLFCQAVNGEVL
jgi:molecular chaperone HscA